ncbi:CYTH domain-containing protein [Aquimarina rubra]|uniref:CYTH domain-containing protein n=1 Tax=Aquimarina rubra TaxID=1920033 RepID=A0ABW5LHH1_9FLAO
MIEIERKFLVTSEMYKQEAKKSTLIVQGFLNTDPERTVRIRIKGKQGFITVKGIGNTSGTTRFEWEKEIPVNEAEALIKICEPGVIEKIRYEVSSGNHIIEVDEFLEDNKGLTIAEIELSDENETFIKPDWLGEEVTGNPRYYNSQISKNPFTEW